MGQLESVKNAPETAEPVVVTCSASPLRKMVSRFFYNGRRLGVLVMLEKETVLSSVHFNMLRTISVATGDAIARYAPYLLPDDTRIRRLLYELLIGTPPEELAQYIAEFSPSGYLCALCIRQNRYTGLRQLKEHVAGALETAFPRLPFTFHENGIAALVPLDDASGLSNRQLEALTDFAKTESLQIGVSNVFSGIDSFAQQYFQSCRAMELDKRLGVENVVCRYVDYAFFDLLCGVKQPAQLESFCHPALEMLRRYDGENDTDLFNTLGIYLQCDCNIKRAAEKMFVHRNSLAYRLRRIAELTRVDLEDSGTRFLLNMSYRILRFIGISLHATEHADRHA